MFVPYLAIQNAFNPRSYKRSDSNRVYIISPCSAFNPRSYKRSDIVGSLKYYIQIFFQSTLLQEERQSNYVFIKCSNTFNPRSYKRSDFVNYVNNRITLMLSIHAPTRGATISHSFPILKSASFNPRSYKRSDTPHVHLTQTLTYFQSTLLQEERRFLFRS